MYRKYSLRRTQVLNTYNYLLEATQIQTNAFALFHQILISSNSLPALLDQAAIEKAIEQSQNQNCINEVSGKFEFYLDQNLLQIRLRQDLKPITQMAHLPIRQALKLICALNLDLVIAIKQTRSMMRHQQESSSNSHKFFSRLILKANSSELVIPFIEGEQIHFYDVYYQQAFGINREKQKNIDDRTLKRKISQKKMKKKSDVATEDPINSDEIIFEKYLQLIVLIFSSQDILLLNESIGKLGTSFQPEIIKKAEKIGNSTADRTQKMFMELLYKCLLNQSEYSLNIFIKECDILVEKHDQMQKSFPSDQKVELRHDQKIKNSKSCLTLNKNDKVRQSASIYNDRPATRQSEKRLKGSKSLINLKGNLNGTGSLNHRSLKSTKGLFSKSKQKLQDKSNLFDQSWAACSKSKISGFGSPSPSIASMACSATSNWFGQSMSEKQSVFKLRNLKKTNNFANISSALQNQTHISQTEKPKQQFDRVDESQMSRLSKLIRKDSLKKQQIPKELNDQDTMTEQISQPFVTIPIQTAIELGKSRISLKREIVNTLTFNFHQQTRKIPEERKIQTPKKHKNAYSQQISEFAKTNIDNPQEPLRQTIQQVPSKRVMQTPSTIQKDKKIKKKTSINNQPLDQQQFQQICLTKKQDSKIFQNTSILKKTVAKQNRTSQVQKAATSVMQPKKPQVKQIKQNILTSPLTQVHKMFYTKHFQFVLKFMKQKIKTLNTLPHFFNLGFVINFLYYQTNIEYNKLTTIDVYKRLIDQLNKKQQQIQEERQENYFLFRVSFESIWTKVKKVRQIQLELSKGVPENALSEKINESKSQIMEFYTLISESNQFLEGIFKDLSAYVLANKAHLLNEPKQPKFILSLQLLYLVTLSMIISTERQNYYKSMVQEKYENIKDCFHFRCDSNVEEYLDNYKKKLQNIDPKFISVQEELNFFRNQYNKYK